MDVAVGGSSVWSFRLRASREGSETLLLELRRPWMKDDPAQSSVRVEIECRRLL